MPHRRRLSLVAAAILAASSVAACSFFTGPPASPTGGPRGTAPPSSGSPGEGTGERFDHPTGAKDVVLRYEEGGGFMLMEWSLTQVPIFTLYGDGTVVFRDPSTQPEPDANGLLAYRPMRTARLSPEQMQQLLAFAVTEGGLGAARERYEHPGVADAGTATFTINAGRTKTVEIYALGLDEGAPDPLIRSQFSALAERLRSFDQDGALPTEEYDPHGWRAILVDTQGAVPARSHPWPWPNLTPRDFPAEAEEPTLPAFHTRVMDRDEIAALGLGDLKGGLLGYYAKAPDGNTYSVPIRPLLPDEDA